MTLTPLISARLDLLPRVFRDSKGSYVAPKLRNCLVCWQWTGMKLSSGNPQRRFLALTLLNPAGSTLSLVRVRLEEDENHHAGDRNIEPNGERQACNSAVHREPAGQREKERGEHHRQSDDGKDYVAG